MAKAPPIPTEQRSFQGPDADPAEGKRDRRDDRTQLQSGQPGDADANLKNQGRYGNLHQNVSSVQHKTQDR